MGDSPISLDLGSLANYAEDRIRHWLGKDEATEAWNDQFKKRWQNALEQSRWVQCIGMHQPVAIEQIYQPVAVYRAAPEWQKRASATPTSIGDLILRGNDAILIAGPGRGKSTLLHWLFLQLLSKRKTHSAFLFILRTENAVADLEQLIERLASGRRPHLADRGTIILLVDGYDEIDEDQRKRVSAALNQVPRMFLRGQHSSVVSVSQPGHDELLCRGHRYL